jgi:hypothetical protein
MIRNIVKGLVAGWVVKKISNRASRRRRSYDRS